MNERPVTALSTYALFAASVPSNGSATPVTREPFTATVPVPSGLSEILPLRLVELISLPFTFKLSTVNSVIPAREVLEAPSSSSVVPIVTLEFVSFAFAIALSLILTTPVLIVIPAPAVK